VFDNPRTVVVRHDEGRPVWNAVLAPVAIDYGFTIDPRHFAVIGHCAACVAPTRH